MYVTRDPDILQRLQLVTKEFCRDATDTINEMLVHQKIYFAGSTVLQCIIGEVLISESDLDIFCKSGHKDPLLKTLNSVGYENSKTGSPSFWEFHGWHVYKLQSNSLHIDVIVFDDENERIQDVVKSVDMSCTMNYYDGDAVHTFHDLDFLRRKQSFFINSSKYGNKNRDQRLEKYRQRGFNIVMKESL